MKKNFSVLVTGSCGFIGKNLLERLLFKNILTIGTYFQRKNFIKSSKIKYIKIDTCNYENFNNKDLNPDVIVHLSNKVLTASMLKGNKLVNFVDSLKSILNILNFCNINKTKKLIYISSSTGYPSSKNKLKEKDYFSNDLPIEHYLVGSISRILEKIIFIYKNIFNLRTQVIILRPSAIYGRNDNFGIRSARLIPYLIKKIISAKSTIIIPGSGSLVRNWVNVSEFVNLIIKLIFTQKKRDVLVMNVSSDKNFSTLQITKKILKILNKKKIRIKKRIIFEKKLNHRILDNDKMKKLGFSVDNKSIDYYLKETIHWYKNSL